MFAYLDTETCGLHGVPVLLQYAIDDGPIVLHHLWFETVQSSLDVILKLMDCTVVGFNLAFDHFHLQKFFNMLSMVEDKTKPPTVEQMHAVEMEARDGLCLKPRDAIDLMLVYRKNEFQKAMSRKDIRIRRIPAVLANSVASYLNKNVILDPILFAKKPNNPHFNVVPRDDTTELVDIKLAFNPSLSLKALAARIFGVQTINFGDISAGFYPKEHGYAPFANAVLSEPGKLPWPQVIHHHIDHWQYNEKAREYASNDVLYTRMLHKHSGAVSCDDSVLACAVASCRWKGYAIDEVQIRKVIAQAKLAIVGVPMSPAAAREWINEHATDIELAIVSQTTRKAALEVLAKLGGPASDRATKVLLARQAAKKINLLRKLLIAGRLHASFRVIGSLSGRMSGTDQLNALGIERSKEIRSCFPLAFKNEKLLGGDLESFEISIADAVYNDPKLREQLLTCAKCGHISGRPCVKCGSLDKKSFHGLFGMGFYGLSYDEIMATKKFKGTEKDLYTKSKTGGFATLYGAQPFKLQDSMGIELDQARLGFDKFWSTFKVAGAQRKIIIEQFSGLKDPVTYIEPADYCESLLGFRRYFTTENYLVKTLAAIAKNPPDEWDVPLRVFRSKEKGFQSVLNATRSALFGAAFSIQNSSVRQASNHQIQSTGAGVNKRIQVDVWKLQPHGANEWYVRPMNVHDEQQIPTKPELAQAVAESVKTTVEGFIKLIPLIWIDFGELSTWADK